MYNSNIPDKQEIPSSKQLLKSTIWAAVVAAVILVTIVMPAEYGIDPTGIGNVLGLKRMGEIKMSLNQEAAGEKQAVVADSGTSGSNSSGTFDPAGKSSHETVVTLAPDEGMEVKLAMDEGDVVNFEWFTDGADASFDVHGDSRDLGIDYHNYSKGNDSRQQGELTAEFTGSHGWWWRNRSDSEMTITLKTDGTYSDLKQYR